MPWIQWEDRNDLWFNTDTQEFSSTPQNTSLPTVDQVRLDRWNNTPGSVMDKVRAMGQDREVAGSGLGLPETIAWAQQNGLIDQAGIQEVMGSGEWTAFNQAMHARDPFAGAWNFGRHIGDPFANFAQSNNVSPTDALAAAMAYQFGSTVLGGTGAGGATTAATTAETAAPFGGFDAAAVAGADYGLGSAATGTVAPFGGFDAAAVSGADYGLGSAATGATTVAGSEPLISNFAHTNAPTNPTTGAPLGGAGYGTAGSASPLARLLGLSQEGSDWLSILGTAGGVGLGMYGSGQQADALRDIAAQSRADRAPFYNASVNYLQNPQAYADGPGRAFMDATLRRLSAQHGNPIDSPTAMGLATQAGLLDWRDAVSSFGNLGLSGEDSRNQLMASATGADANRLNALGYGLGQLTQPQPTSLEALLRRLNSGNAGLA